MVLSHIQVLVQECRGGGGRDHPLAAELRHCQPQCLHTLTCALEFVHSVVVPEGVPENGVSGTIHIGSTRVHTWRPCACKAPSPYGIIYL